MNVIFLDIDGVLRTHKSDKEWYGQNIPTNVFNRKFSPNSINILNEIIKLTNARLIISSTWREHYSINELRKIFTNNGYKYDIYDITTKLGYRGEEIQYWLDTHDVNRYIVVDDNIKEISKNINNKRIVECLNGLTEKEFQTIIRLMN